MYIFLPNVYATIIFLLLSETVSSLPEPPPGPEYPSRECTHNSNFQCALLWDQFKQGWGIRDGDDHGGQVSCDRSRDIYWNDQDTVTIRYSGQKTTDTDTDSQDGITKTCYVATYPLLGLPSRTEPGKPVRRGVVSADIAIHGDNLYDSTAIWPAFWLFGTAATWPDGGELDIAERQFGKTATHLIGNSNLPFQNMVTFSEYSEGFSPDGLMHTYGLEWEFNQAFTSVNFKTYYDNNLIGSSQASQSDSHLSRRHVFAAFLKGSMEVIFDADSHGYGGTYEMEVSNVHVYEMYTPPPPPVLDEHNVTIPIFEDSDPIIAEGGKCGLFTTVGKCDNGLKCLTNNEKNDIILCKETILSSQRIACVCKKDGFSATLIISLILAISFLLAIVGIFIYWYQKKTRNRRSDDESFDAEDTFDDTYSVTHDSKDEKNKKYHIFEKNQNKKDPLSMRLL